MDFADEINANLDALYRETVELNARDAFTVTIAAAVRRLIGDAPPRLEDARLTPQAGRTDSTGANAAGAEAPPADPHGDALSHEMTSVAAAPELPVAAAGPADNDVDVVPTSPKKARAR